MENFKGFVEFYALLEDPKFCNGCKALVLVESENKKLLGRCLLMGESTNRMGASHVDLEICIIRPEWCSLKEIKRRKPEPPNHREAQSCFNCLHHSYSEDFIECEKYELEIDGEFQAPIYESPCVGDVPYVCDGWVDWNARHRKEVKDEKSTR